MLHVVDADDELMWTDDHDPPTPTTQWKPGQTIEYTRTVFVPIYPYVGEAGLADRPVFAEDADPADARGRGRRAARVQGRAGCSCSRRARTSSRSSRTAGIRPRSPSTTRRSSGSGPRSRRRWRSRTRRRTPRSISTSINPGGVFNENAAGDRHPRRHRARPVRADAPEAGPSADPASKRIRWAPPRWPSSR